MSWEVVGGGDKGGILVRSGQGTSSEQLPERLSTGARVEELELVGERLHYKLISGTGPATGWVSTSLKDKPLLQRLGETKDAKEPPKDAGDLREGDYYVTLGVLFKKLGTDPEKASITKLKRSVGSVVHTTGKVWRGSGGGYWVELDVGSGDSGAGEKAGYVMIDASGFGTPGPCLQIAAKADGPPILLKSKPRSEVKAWDDGSIEKDFLVLQKTTVGEVRVILGMLFKIAKPESITVFGKDGSELAPETSVKEAGFQSGDQCAFEHAEGKPMKLVVMSPLEQGVKLTDLDIKSDWTVGWKMCINRADELQLVCASRK